MLSSLRPQAEDFSKDEWPSINSTFWPTSLWTGVLPALIASLGPFGLKALKFQGFAPGEMSQGFLSAATAIAGSLDAVSG